MNPPIDNKGDSHVVRNASWRALWLAALVFTLLLGSLTASHPAEAQFQDDLFRLISKIHPSSTRHLSAEAKGEIGEQNIKYGIKSLANNADELLELEARFFHRSALSKGIDSIYAVAKRSRFHIVEAKATSQDGRITLSLLHQLKNGARQMDDTWVRQNLALLREAASKIAADQGSTPELRASARRILGAVESMEKRNLQRVEKTMVVTRLRGVDRKYLNPSSKFFDSVNSDIFSVIDNVVEVDRNGKVLAVYAGGAARTH